MKRIRNLGLAVLAALALTSVLGAAGASASEFVAEKYSAAVSGSGSSHTLGFSFVYSTCYKAPQLEGNLGSRSAALSANAKDTTCTGPGGEYSLKMNSCQFVFRPGLETSAGVYGGTFDISCPEGKTIQWGGAGAACLASIGSQSGLKATYETLGSGSNATVKVNAQATGLKYTQTKGWACESGSFENGTWTGSWTLQATNGGTQTGLRLTHKAPISIGGTPAGLVAESYPVSLVGPQSATHSYGFQVGKGTCETTQLSSGPIEWPYMITLQAEYSGCLLNGNPATVKMNGCSYRLYMAGSGPYTGTEEISCPAGKAIEIVAIPSKPKCTVTIPAQTTAASGISYTNEASTIGVGFSVSGISYKQQKGEGLGTCTSGEFTTGTYSGSSVLTGYL